MGWGEVGLGWVRLGWVGLGWVGLGWGGGGLGGGRRDMEANLPTDFSGGTKCNTFKIAGRGGRRPNEGGGDCEKIFREK